MSKFFLVSSTQVWCIFYSLLCFTSELWNTNFTSQKMSSVVSMRTISWQLNWSWQRYLFNFVLKQLCTILHCFVTVVICCKITLIHLYSEVISIKYKTHILMFTFHWNINWAVYSVSHWLWRSFWLVHLPNFSGVPQYNF